MSSSADRQPTLHAYQVQLAKVAGSLRGVHIAPRGDSICCCCALLVAQAATCAASDHTATGGCRRCAQACSSQHCCGQTHDHFRMCQAAEAQDFACAPPCSALRTGFFERLQIQRGRQWSGRLVSASSLRAYTSARDVMKAITLRADTGRDNGQARSQEPETAKQRQWRHYNTRNSPFLELKSPLTAWCVLQPRSDALHS